MESLFTFIMDYKGGTYISQGKGTSVKDAIDRWAQSYVLPKEMGLKNRKKAQEDLRYIAEKEDLPPTPILGTRNVWCDSVIILDDGAIINIVKTSMR